MLQALLRGKLSRDHEQIEDILTSNVFGLLRYADPRITAEFIDRARLSSGAKPWAPSTLDASATLSIDWQFWPWWAEVDCIGCEPDVVLTLHVERQRPLLILIEAKLHAGKSSLAMPDGPPSDQLARQWDNLVEKARAIAATPALIYVTSHYSFPNIDVDASIEEFKAKRGTEPSIAWLSWRDLLPVLKNYPLNTITNDLALLLHRMDLTYFGGVTSIPPTEISWKFVITFDWNFKIRQQIDWRF